MTETSGENLSSSLEDYLEIIFHLEQVHRVARAKDIADQTPPAGFSRLA